MNSVDDITEKDLAAMIQLKNHLLTYSPDELIKIYNTKEKYLYFLDKIVVLSRRDYGFLFLDKRIIESIRRVVETRRDEFKSGINNDCINSIIRMCNHIDNTDVSGKKIIISQYILYQSDARGLEISTIKQMLLLIIYDALVYDAIIDNDWSNITSDGFLLGSLMYLTAYTPSVFLNEKYNEIVMDKLKSISKNSGIFKKSLKEYVNVVTCTINNLKSQKEE